MRTAWQESTSSLDDLRRAWSENRELSLVNRSALPTPAASTTNRATMGTSTSPTWTCTSSMASSVNSPKRTTSPSRQRSAMSRRNSVSSTAGLMTTSVSMRKGTSWVNEPPANSCGSSSTWVTPSAASVHSRVRLDSSSWGTTNQAGSGSKATPLDSAHSRHQAAARRAGWMRLTSLPS